MITSILQVPENLQAFQFTAKFQHYTRNQRSKSTIGQFDMTNKTMKTQQSMETNGSLHLKTTALTTDETPMKVLNIQFLDKSLKPNLRKQTSESFDCGVDESIEQRQSIFEQTTDMEQQPRNNLSFSKISNQNLKVSAAIIQNLGKSNRTQSGLITTIRSNDFCRKRQRNRIQSLNTNQIRFMALYNLMGAIPLKDVRNVIDMTSFLLNNCIESQQLDLFIQVSNFLGQYLTDLGELHKAAFFFNQYRLMAEMSFRFNWKSEALIHLAGISTSLLFYDNAIRMLKKALEFAWVAKDIILELDIYERIGINYFYLGQTEQAQMYHNRFVLGDTETEISPLRTISTAIIMRHLQHNRIIPLTKLNRVYLCRLSLPIRYKFEEDQVLDQNLDLNINEQDKCIAYLNARAEIIIDKILSEPDFKNYELEQPQNGRLKQAHDQFMKLGLLSCSVEVPNVSRNNQRRDDSKLDFTFVDRDRLLAGKSISRIHPPKFKTLFGTEIDNQEKNKVPRVIELDPYKFKIPLKRFLKERAHQQTLAEYRMKSMDYRIRNNMGNVKHIPRSKVYLNHTTPSKAHISTQLQTNPDYLQKKYSAFFNKWTKVIS